MKDRSKAKASSAYKKGIIQRKERRKNEQRSDGTNKQKVALSDLKMSEPLVYPKNQKA